MASNLYLCPWDGVVRSAGGHDGAQQNADSLLVYAAGHSRELAACFNRAVKVPRHEQQGKTGSPDSGVRRLSSVGRLTLMHFISALNAQVCNLAISIRHILLTPFFLPRSSSAHSRPHCLPLESGMQRVGSALLLIPPLRWIAKWKWLQGMEAHPDQLTSASFLLSATVLSDSRCRTSTKSQRPSYEASQPLVVWMYKLKLYQY